MDTEELAATRRRVEAAEQALTTAQAARTEAIRLAHAEGMRPVDIARAAGVARSRVYQVTDPH